MSALNSNSGFAEQGEFNRPTQEIFTILKQRSSSGASHVPSQPLNIPSPSGMLSRDSGLPRDTRNTVGTSRNVVESLLAREGPSSSIFEKQILSENSRNLASSLCGLGSGNTGNAMEHGGGVRRDPQSSSMPA